jgi:hypothetical protein
LENDGDSSRQAILIGHAFAGDVKNLKHHGFDLYADTNLDILGTLDTHWVVKDMRTEAVGSGLSHLATRYSFAEFGKFKTQTHKRKNGI